MKNYYKNIISCVLLILFGSFAYGQEICNNGIDDDGNGLIDLNDTTGCTCTSPVLSLIPNPSFENMNCCPSTFTQLNCAQGWIQASDGTSDYMNTCGFVFPAATAAGLVPFPNGNGIAGFISTNTYREYIGACLNSPMLANSSYSLQINIASTPVSGFGGVCNGGNINYSPSNIVLYGSTNCNALPFSGYGCAPSNWVVLGSVLYTPSSNWGVITITFTPNVNINAIMIGSPCSLPSDYDQGCYPYFYVDNLLLNLTTLFTSSITQSGSLCNNNVQLTGTAVTGATYQWYLNGIAIVGQTSITLDVSGNNLPPGNYSLVTSANPTCARASYTVAGLNSAPIINAAGPFCQNDSLVTLTADSIGGVWSGNGITDSINGTFDPSIANIGNDTVIYTISDTFGCTKSDTIVLIVKASPTVSISIPLLTCTNDTAQLTATISGGSGTYTSNIWSGTGAPDLSSTTITNPTFVSNSAGTFTLTFIVTDNQGCIAAIDTSITVKAKPIIQSISVPYYLCAGDSIPIQAINVNGGSGVYSSESWSGYIPGNIINIFASNTLFTSSISGIYNLSFTVVDTNGCIAIATAPTEVVSTHDASFIYASATFCRTGIDPAPAITGNPGGTFFSSPPGLNIDATTGIIDLSTSGTGTYSVSYFIYDSLCPAMFTNTITIADSATASIYSYASNTYCRNSINPSPVFSPPASAGTFSSTPTGLVFVNSNSGEIDLSGSTPGTYTVTNTLTLTGECPSSSSSTTITILSADDANFNYPSATYCLSGINPSPTITGLTSGTFSSNPSSGISIDSQTGIIDLSSTNTGHYFITYSTNGTCPNSFSILMTIADSGLTATYAYLNNSFCQNEANPFPIFPLGSSAGSFSASPGGLVFINQNTGEIDLEHSQPGTYSITNTIPSISGCASSTFNSTITISAAPSITSSTSLQAVCDGTTISVNLSSSILGSSFIWTDVAVVVTGASAGTGNTITQTLHLNGTTQGSVVYTVTPSANGCVGDSVTIPFIVNPLPIADTTVINFTPATCGDSSGALTNIFMALGQPPYQFSWTDSNGIIVGTADSLSNVPVGNYTLHVTDANGCSSIAGTFHVSTSSSAVVADFTADTLIGENPLTVNFTNTSSGANNYIWTFGTGDTSATINPTYIYQPTGVFNVCLIASNTLGCIDTLCDTVNVKINSIFIVPNVFSPNGDGINDEFKILGDGIKTIDAEIYNRWGQKLYEWHTVNGGWNGYSASGVKAAEGTYYYIVNASKTDNKIYQSKGYFLLIRN